MQPWSIVNGATATSPPREAPWRLGGSPLVLLGAEHEGLRPLRERLRDDRREARFKTCARWSSSVSQAATATKLGARRRLEPERDLARIEHLGRQPHDALLHVVAGLARKSSREVEERIRDVEALLAMPRETRLHQAPSPRGKRVPPGVAVARR